MEGNNIFSHLFTLFILIVVLIVIVILPNTQGMYLQSPGSTGSVPSTCTANENVSIVEIYRPSQEITFNLGSNFKYLQTSMILGSCYYYKIIRGNRFINRHVLNVSHILETEVSMSLSHTTVEGTHAYTISIEAGTINFTEVINTSLKCGKFQGFRVKAVGATLCTLVEQEEGHQDPKSEMPRIALLPEENHREGEKRPQISNDEDEDDSVAVNIIRELHQWSNGAYVMAICFVFSVYALFLVAKMCQSGGFIYEIVHARQKTSTHDPSIGRN